MSETTPDDKQTAKKNRKRRLLRGCLIEILVILCIPLGVRIWFLWGIPDFPPPVDLDQIRSMSVAEEDNAAPVYREAANLYQEETPVEHEPLLDLPEYCDWHESLPGLTDYRKRNQQALEVWKRGTTRDHFVSEPLATRTWFSKSEFEDYRHRELSRLALLHSVQLQTQGQHELAWDWILAVLRNSRQFGHQGGILDRFYGTSAFTMATEMTSVWASHPDVSPVILRQAIIDLEEIWTGTPQTSLTLKCEYAMTAKGLDNINGLLDNSSVGQTITIRCMNWTVGQPEASHRLSNFYLHNLLAAVDLPRFKRPKQAGKTKLFDQPSALTFNGTTWSIDEFEEMNNSWRGLYISFSTSMAHHFIDACDREQVRYEITRLFLISQLYQRDRGEFPETLDVLVPDYVEAIPLDGFDGLPMKYRNDDEEKVIYSVFLNETDDGGTDYDHKHLKDLRDYGIRLTLRTE